MFRLDTFGSYVQELMEMKGVTRAALARESKIPFGRLTKIINGEAKVLYIDEVESILDAAGFALYIRPKR